MSQRIPAFTSLFALRGHSVEFRNRLYAAINLAAVRPCRYKDLEMFGFRGRLLANVDLPDGFAVGRAVSHGYGWLCREFTPSVGTGGCR